MIPVELIRQQDFTAIVDRALALSEEERLAALKALRQMDFCQDVFVDPTLPYRDVWGAFALAKVACTRSVSELKQFPVEWPARHTVLHTLIRADYSAAHEALVCFFEKQEPDYLDRVVEESLRHMEISIDFRLLWRFWQHGWVTFVEGIFASALFHIKMFTRSVEDELRFLRDNPEIIEKVLLPFSHHDVPVLLRSKWQKKEAKDYCGVVTEFWDDIFTQLYAENRLPRRLVRDLLASLTLNFKKGRLDWHIRLIKLFDPSEDEWLTYQDLLLAALYASSTSVLNFAVQTVQKISHRDTFDHAAFMQHLPAITGREKCDKSLLLALDIADMLAERFPEYRSELAQNASGALIQTAEKVQLRAAQLMLKYSSLADCAPLIAPYRGGLKHSVAALLHSDKPVVEECAIPALDHASVAVPENWDALLFHTGKTLAGREALDIELFYAGVIALQDDIPADYKKQMQPYYKKLMKPYLSSTLLYTLRDFFHEWLTGKPAPAPEKHERRFPHLLNQNRLVLERLHHRCQLSLLATPTHAPFYVSPQALVERLLAHEQRGYPVDVGDLIVACNRILPGEITAEVRQQALLLQGDYACAVHYLLGITDEILAADDALLPLWTQITRTRDANGVYPQYRTLAPEQATWPTVAEPFYYTYQVSVDKDEAWTWRYLVLNNNERYRWQDDLSKHYSERYYYISLHHDNCCSKEDFLYCLSLVPHYMDVLLQYVTPYGVTGNEAREIEDCIYSLTFLLENQLRVHHGGWVYIAVCLLFEKKISRDLAAEYIQLALQQGFLDRVYLSECIAHLLMHKFAPVNRFIEYLDNHDGNPAVKAFQYEILASCIDQTEDSNLPINYKKLVAYHKEYQR